MGVGHDWGKLKTEGIGGAVLEGIGGAVHPAATLSPRSERWGQWCLMWAAPRQNCAWSLSETRLPTWLQVPHQIQKGQPYTECAWPAPIVMGWQTPIINSFCCVMHNGFAFLFKSNGFCSITNSTVQRIEYNKALGCWDPNALMHISLINYRSAFKLGIIRLSCNVMRIWNTVYKAPTHKFQINGSF